MVVTVTLMGPAAVGAVVIETVSCVSVAAVTLPTAPLSNVTALLPGVSSKPSPLMINWVALAARLARLAVTLGTTVATFTAEPLFSFVVATIAVRSPASSGGVVN